jgi:hypothetical protein
MNDPVPPRLTPIEVRTSFHANALPTMALLAVAGILGIGLVYGAFVHGVSGKWFAALAGFVFCAGMAAYHGRDAFSQRVQLVLTPDGLRDRRGADLLVPWSAIASGAIEPPAGTHGVFVNFKLRADTDPQLRRALRIKEGPSLLWSDDNEVRINVAPLAITPQNLLKAAKGFAPHIEIDLRQPWL